MSYRNVILKLIADYDVPKGHKNPNEYYGTVYQIFMEEFLK